jgi:NADH dehydrogenase
VQLAVVVNNMTRVVIVGAGFGGLAATRVLAKRGVAIELIDRHNHHLFQPLLYQVATAGLAVDEISMPIRSVPRGFESVHVVLGEVTSIDRATREVTLRDAAGIRTIEYDWLVLACGVKTTYFGHDDWGNVASSMKTLDDAARVRRKLLLAFATAEAIADPHEAAAWLTFVVIGGGPTGVELAGAIAELSHRSMAKDFRHIDPKRARIVLVEAGNRLLAQFPENLSVFARRDLERLGVEVRLGAKVERITANEVVIGTEAVAMRTVIWAAGVTPVPVGRWLGAETDGAGRVVVTPFLHLKDDDRVFVLGDGAHVMQDGAPLPPATRRRTERRVDRSRTSAPSLGDHRPQAPRFWRMRRRARCSSRAPRTFPGHG